MEELIDMGVHFIDFVDTAELDIKGSYYEILTLIFHRGELDLTQIGFTNLDSNDDNKKFKASKKKLGIKYQYFLYKALKYGIEKLSRKAVDFYKRDFIVLCIAICYFRVPEFKNAFISATVRDGIEKIPEWRDTHWDINEQPIMPEESDLNLAIDHFFNWQDFFYNSISGSSSFEDNQKLLNNIMTMK